MLNFVVALWNILLFASAHSFLCKNGRIIYYSNIFDFKELHYMLRALGRAQEKARVSTVDEGLRKFPHDCLHPQLLIPTPLQNG